MTSGEWRVVSDVVTGKWEGEGDCRRRSTTNARLVKGGEWRASVMVVSLRPNEQGKKEECQCARCEFDAEPRYGRWMIDAMKIGGRKCWS